MNKLSLYILTLSIFSLITTSFAYAAPENTEQLLSSKKTSVSAETPVIIPQPYVDITPEKKIEIRKGLMKKIQNTAVNSDVLERKRLMNAIENLNLSDFKVSEITEDGNLKEAEVEAIYKFLHWNFQDNEQAIKRINEVYQSLPKSNEAAPAHFHIETLNMNGGNINEIYDNNILPSTIKQLTNEN